MHPYFWNNLYFGWGWLLWLGIVFPFFLSMVNWRYVHAIYRKNQLGARVKKDALHILNERYAGGEITHEEFNRVRSDILKTA